MESLILRCLYTDELDAIMVHNIIFCNNIA